MIDRLCFNVFHHITLLFYLSNHRIIAGTIALVRKKLANNLTKIVKTQNLDGVSLEAQTKFELKQSDNFLITRPDNLRYC